MDLRRPSYSSAVEQLAKSVCTSCKVCVERMWEPERQALAPAYLVIYYGDDGGKNIDAFVEDAAGRGWKVERRGYGRARVDPTPDYKVEE